MLRRIVVSELAAAAVLAAVVWSGARPVAWAQQPTSSGSIPPSGRVRLVKVAAPAPVGNQQGERRSFTGDPIIIPNGRLRLIDLEDVPSQRDGVLLFIGTEVQQGEQVPEHELISVQIGDTKKQFRRLKEGDTVQADQLLAMVDDTLARADVDIKDAKLKSAKADMVAAEKTRDEALQRWKTQRRLIGDSARGQLPATTMEDLRGAELTYYRYVEEAEGKNQAIEVAKQEVNQARKTLTMYEIRPKVSGSVKLINKHRGEAVKSLDAVFQIQNYDHLRVDALLPEQYANHLVKGMEVAVEPTLRESPTQTLVGHREEVTGVAVSKDPQHPLIVSASKDRTLRVWDLASSEGRVRESRVLKCGAPVRALACTPPSAAANLCLSGDEQGKGLIWDLNDLNKSPVELKAAHRGAITSVAFSPDGRTCATAGQGFEINIWDTASGNLRYQLTGHRNVVTALHFLANNRLLSVGRDPAFRFWQLGDTQGEALPNETILRREALVDNLGVSPDGKQLMDEHGSEMRIISVPKVMTEAILQTTGKKFMYFALFSPDGKSALTTSEEGGVVQLWHIDKTRSSEVRQFVAPVRLPAKSAAFAPNGKFVVASVNDRVYVWPMPDQTKVEPIKAIVTNIEKPIEAAGNQVKVTAEFENLGQRLRPGDVVTLVAYPQK